MICFLSCGFLVVCLWSGRCRGFGGVWRRVVLLFRFLVPGISRFLHVLLGLLRRSR